MTEVDMRHEALVRRLEMDARQAPGMFRFRAVALVITGYLFLAMLICIGLGILAMMAALAVVAFENSFGGAIYSIGRFAIWIAIPLVTALGALMRVLWSAFHEMFLLRVPKPDGVFLQRSVAPELFDLIEQYRSRLGSPRVHEVMIVDDFTAALFARPRLGLFGLHENYLILGLPLMQAVSPEQFRATLAHELGHLSGRHGRFGSWVYSTCKNWFIFAENAALDASVLTCLLHLFLKWYLLRLGAYAFVLGRSQEVEADRASARLAGKEAAATGLITESIKLRMLRQIMMAGTLEASPEQMPYRRDLTLPNTEFEAEDEPPAIDLYHLIKMGPPPARAEQWLKELLEEKTGFADTHPALGDRLVALGYPRELGVENIFGQRITLPTPPKQSALEYYFGDKASHMRKTLAFQDQ